MMVISGGQTGVDRGALIAAALQGYAHGGWCPKGRKAEDGVIPPDYPMTEAVTDRYEERTQLNIECSDATLILTYEHYDRISGGTALTRDVLQRVGGKKCFILTLERDASFELDRAAAKKIRGWLAYHQPKILNVAGPRESKARGIQNHAAQVVSMAIQTGARCLCGRPIPEAAWQATLVATGEAPLQCSRCGCTTFASDVSRS